MAITLTSDDKEADFADVGHDVSYEGPSRLTWMCRPNALARAISNVVANAVKHGSVVRVQLSSGRNGNVEINVSHDGPGIPDELRQKVFEPFFKAEDYRPTAGGGFGLSIAREVVQGHGGAIELLTRRPHGLTVRIVLPPIDPGHCLDCGRDRIECTGLEALVRYRFDTGKRQGKRATQLHLIAKATHELSGRPCPEWAGSENNGEPEPTVTTSAIPMAILMVAGKRMALYFVGVVNVDAFLARGVCRHQRAGTIVNNTGRIM